MGTVTRLTNKKRLRLIIQRTMREAKEKDPDCMVYDTSPLIEEAFRQCRERAEKRTKQKKG